MKCLKNEKGYSIVEFIFIIALLMIFGFTTFSLLIAGSESYENISNRKEVQSELRLASSYVNMKIRQNDSEGTLSVVKNPYNQTNALLIKERFDQKEYHTWVYFDKGCLWEATLEKGMQLTTDVSFPIATLERFEMSYQPQTKLIQTIVVKNIGEKEMNILTKIKLKSKQ